VDPFDLALAVRGMAGKPVAVDDQRGQHVPDRLGGEVQAAVDAHHGGDPAERAARRVVHQRHAQRGEHRSRVRGQRDGPPDDGAGAVVDHAGQPRPHRRPARRQHQDRQVLVVSLPGTVTGRRRPRQIHLRRTAGMLTLPPPGPFSRSQLAGERLLQRAQRHQCPTGPAGDQEIRDRQAGGGAGAGGHRGPGPVHGRDVAPKVGVRLPVGRRQPVRLGARPNLDARGVGTQPAPHGAFGHVQAGRGQPDVSGGQPAGDAQRLQPGHRRRALFGTDTPHDVSFDATSTDIKPAPPADINSALNTGATAHSDPEPPAAGRVAGGVSPPGSPQNRA
jgi:hypothetical protein